LENENNLILTITDAGDDTAGSYENKLQFLRRLLKLFRIWEAHKGIFSTIQETRRMADHMSDRPGLHQPWIWTLGCVGCPLWHSWVDWELCWTKKPAALRQGTVFAKWKQSSNTVTIIHTSGDLGNVSSSKILASIMTRLRAGRTRFDFRQGQGRDFFIFATGSRPTLGPTQPSIQWDYSGRGVTLTTHHHLLPSLRMCGATPTFTKYVI